MKRILPLFLALALLLTGCTAVSTTETTSQAVSQVDSPSSAPESASSQLESAGEVSITDSNGSQITLDTSAPRVVAAYGSFAEAWLLAGGELVGVTQDALEQRDLGLPEDIAVVGTVKEPNAEEIIALEPDLVLLASDITAQADIRDVLENAGLACAFFQVDTFADYAFMMEQLCAVTGREDLYEENVTQVGQQIEEAQANAALSSTRPNVLLIRAFSTGIKAKTDDELAAVFAVADALRNLRERNISTKIFDSGLGISLFRDNSTRTRFSFASACNLLGLEVQDLDEGKSQIAHGETVRETANMISFMADVIGIRDDMYIGKGNAYMHEVVDAVTAGHKDGVLEQKPTLVNLQCDIDHPTQCMADMLHIIHEFGGVENLKGKKVAMTWAYSPSYGKPLSVPQGVIGLMSRFGMDVVLAHPEGYEVMPEVEAVAAANAAKTGGTFTKTHSMAEAFKDADIVYPKSWAPFAAMEKRTDLYAKGDSAGIQALEKELLAQNAQHKDWCCTEELMKTTRDGKALYLHCLPADINGVSCVDGEVEASVFDRYRDPLYKEASFKPYIIAAMIFLAKVKDPQATLKALEDRGAPRWFQK